MEGRVSRRDGGEGKKDGKVVREGVKAGRE